MEFVSKTKGNKGKTFCSVYGCNSKASRCPQLAFHKFPRKGSRKIAVENEFGLKETVDIQKAWENALQMGKPCSKYMKICSLHFQESDYFPLYHNAKKKFLKKTAVPSVNLPEIPYLSPIRKTSSDCQSRAESAVLREFNEDDPSTSTVSDSSVVDADIECSQQSHL